MKYFLESDIQEVLGRSSDALHRLANKKVLITGAAGFLGRYFVAVFQAFNRHSRDKISIIALDNHITSTSSSEMNKLKLDENTEWIFGDANLGAQLPDRFDFILHAAGIASPEHYRAKPLETIEVAVNVTKSLLEKAKLDTSQMLFFSSSEIYGDPDLSSIPTKEDYRGHVSSRGPRACYDESKRLGETLCWIYETYYKVHVSVVRPFNIYGPGMMPRDFRVMPNFATSMARGESLKVYGHGRQTRTFCYITDALDGFLRVLVSDKEPNVFNIGNPNPEISILDLAKRISERFSSGLPIEVIPYPSSYPEDEPNRRCPDISRAKTVLGYEPSISLDTGLERFFLWSKKNYSFDII